MTAEIAVIQAVMGVVVVNKYKGYTMDFDKIGPLDPGLQRLVSKLQSYMRSKNGNLLEQVCLNHSDNRYYWCILNKKFILINGSTEMYLLPWKKTDKNEYYIYSHYVFSQGAVFQVPEEEIVFLGFN